MVKDYAMQEKIDKFREIKGAKFVWVDKDNVVHYMSSEQFEKIIQTLEKGSDIAIRVAMLNGLTLIFGGNVFAAEATRMSLAEGLQPIVDMIAECAYPVAGGYMVKGFLKVCQGQEESGKKILKDAGIGYMGTLFIPQILKFLSKLKLFV